MHDIIDRNSIHIVLLETQVHHTYDLFRQQQSGHEHSTPVVVLMDSA